MFIIVAKSSTHVLRLVATLGSTCGFPRVYYGNPIRNLYNISYKLLSLLKLIIPKGILCMKCRYRHFTTFKFSPVDMHQGLANLAFQATSTGPVAISCRNHDTLSVWTCCHTSSHQSWQSIITYARRRRKFFDFSCLLNAFLSDFCGCLCLNFLNFQWFPQIFTVLRAGIWSQNLLLFSTWAK